MSNEIAAESTVNRINQLLGDVEQLNGPSHRCAAELKTICKQMDVAVTGLDDPTWSVQRRRVDDLLRWIVDVNTFNAPQQTIRDIDVETQMIIRLLSR